MNPDFGEGGKFFSAVNEIVGGDVADLEGDVIARARTEGARFIEV